MLDTFAIRLDAVSTTDLIIAFIEIMSANYPNYKGKNHENFSLPESTSDYANR